MKWYDQDRDQKLIKLAQQCYGTPAEWVAKEFNSVNGLSIRASLTALPLVCKSWETRSGASSYVEHCKALMQKGLKWKYPASKIVVPYANIIPSIDGQILAEEWNDAWHCTGEYETDTTDWIDSGALWFLKYDRKRLYFAVFLPDQEQVFDKNPWHPYFDDAFEFFIFPDPRLYTYYELVFTPGGHEYTKRVCQGNTTKYDLKAFRPPTLMWKTSKSETGYMFEGSIDFVDLPGYLLGNSPMEGEMINWIMIRTDRNALSP
ncbi:MAG: hypothetical protein JXR78_05430 [Victivallales bacterium]|nr:hypothetical protein [Victivallales bacterium]